MHRRRVAWGETDAGGIVFYPNYYRWFDDATHELFRAVGYPLPAMFESGLGLPLIEASGRFLTALRYGDEIEIISSVAEIRTHALRVEHEIKRGETTAATGFEVRMLVRLGGAQEVLQPVPIPDAMREFLSPLRR